MKSRSSPNDLHARVAVNGVAARVIARGKQYVPDKQVVNNDSDLPIAVRPYSKAEKSAQGFIDLRGREVGRLVVVGMARDFVRQWVVRCACGRYSTRSAKAIKNPRNGNDRCEHCRYLAFLQREEHYRITGKDRD